MRDNALALRVSPFVDAAALHLSYSDSRQSLALLRFRQSVTDTADLKPTGALSYGTARFRTRLISICLAPSGAGARLQVTIYLSAYVEAANRDAFMAVKQDLLLAFVDCCNRNGAHLSRKRTQVPPPPPPPSHVRSPIWEISCWAFLTDLGDGRALQEVSSFTPRQHMYACLTHPSAG